MRNAIDVGPIIQSRESSERGHYRYARCLACGGKVVMYVHDLGCCETCGRDYFMEQWSRNKYRCRSIPV